MQFTVEIKNFDKLSAAFLKAPVTARGALEEAILMVPEILASVTVPPIVPYRTGQLSLTFFSHVEIGQLVAVWGPTVNYAADVEFGTKPHTIVPVNKKALYWPGARHPVRSVKHPGSAPNPYMERIIQAAQQPINDVFDQALQVIISTIAL